MKVNPFKTECSVIRIPDSYVSSEISRRVHIQMPEELYVEDREIIIAWLNSLYLERRPQQKWHTPEHTPPCPACEEAK